jgi:signal transduction histidine kinase
MEKTILEIPTELLQAAKITPEEAKTELAIRLYQLHKLNDKQAAEMAGDPKVLEAHAWRDNETNHFNLDDFLDWASHDLKTPLNAVIGFTKVIIKGYDGPVTEAQVTDLTTAFNSGQRMLALVSYLVEIARLNKAQVIITKEERNLTEYLTEITDRWKTQNQSRPLTLDLQLASPLINIDSQQFRQIVNHTLAFAAVRITEGTVTLTARDDDQGVYITVQSFGKKGVDKMEMDSAMLGFIITSLINLHGGKMDEPQETEDGFLLKFSLLR